MSTSLTGLEQTLKHQFASSELLRRAVTHRSFDADNYERLEFLGDAVLDLVIAEQLFERFPGAAEGELSRLRANLVRKRTLARLARRLELGRYVVMGDGELKTGGPNRDSILADVFEAIVGAIYLDAGLNAVSDRVSTWYQDDLDGLTLDISQKDAKTRLQEALQAAGKALPEYNVVNTMGRAHDRTFVVQCRCELVDEVFQGEGSSRRVAEQEAAGKMLSFLGGST